MINSESIEKSSLFDYSGPRNTFCTKKTLLTAVLTYLLFNQKSPFSQPAFSQTAQKFKLSYTI